MNLQKKLLLVTSVPLIVVCLVIIFLTEYMVKNNLKEIAKEVAYHIADASHHELITSINEYYNGLNEMATIFAILNSKYNSEKL